MSNTLLTRHQTSTSVTPSIAPSYATQNLNGAPIELTSWTSPSSSRRASILSSPPPYTSSHTFRPTLHLQLQAPGKPCLSLPLPPKPLPIPIFDLSHDDGSLSPEPRYTSIRPARGSGSSYLVSGSCPETKLSTTTYRFGPGKPPVVSLLLPSHSRDEDGSKEEEGQAWDTFTVQSKSLLSRSQRLQHTRLGTFEWRYASRGERKAIKANSVLMLEKILRVAVEGGREEEVRRTVAMLVRNEETRTPGSSASSAGNGGRLMVDLEAWEQGEKMEREMAVVMTVTTAVMMLKKEVDRRRAAQIAIMASAASGGS